MSSTLGIDRSRLGSRHDFENFLHLPQYKLSSPVSQLWHMLGSCDEVCLLRLAKDVSMLKIRCSTSQLGIMLGS